MSYTTVKTEDIATKEEVAERVARLHLVGGQEEGAVKYPAYLPVWSHTEFPPWEEVPYHDAGHRATKDKRHLFGKGSTHRQITPAIGEEIHGVQLSKLSKEGLDDLALLAAERGLLILYVTVSRFARYEPASNMSAATKTSRISVPRSSLK